ncbi:MAG: hypothetical protein ACODAE_10120 [Gemmatimonadota bacterium]
MARQIDSTGDAIRVVFRTDEVEPFLRGWEPVPGWGGDDPLNRAIQASYDALNDAFPDAGDVVEPFVERAPWARDDGYDWHAVDFRFAHDAVERAGHDADALADWVAEHTPDLLFALEDAEGRPVAVRRVR